MNRDNHNNRPMKLQARNTKTPRVQQDCVFQVSDDKEGKNCILGALSQLDGFDHQPQGWADSGPVPETSCNLGRENGGTKEVQSQNEPHPEVGSLFANPHGVEAQTRPLTW